MEISSCTYSCECQTKVFSMNDMQFGLNVNCSHPSPSVLIPALHAYGGKYILLLEISTSGSRVLRFDAGEMKMFSSRDHFMIPTSVYATPPFNSDTRFSIL